MPSDSVNTHKELSLIYFLIDIYDINQIIDSCFIYLFIRLDAKVPNDIVAGSSIFIAITYECS